VKWVSSTLFQARHESPTVELEALLDLSREGTFLEAIASRDVTPARGCGWWSGPHEALPSRATTPFATLRAEIRALR